SALVMVCFIWLLPVRLITTPCRPGSPASWIPFPLRSQKTVPAIWAYSLGVGVGVGVAVGVGVGVGVGAKQKLAFTILWPEERVTMIGCGQSVALQPGGAVVGSTEIV